MHGIGNDFVMLDCTSDGPPAVNPGELSRAMCDRKFGVGADGIIFIERAGPPAFRMRMFNPDGSESEMCGNGVRCVARYLLDEGLAPGPTVVVETGNGPLTLEQAGDGQIRVDMGPAGLTRGEIGMLGPADERFVGAPVSVGTATFSGTAVSMGNPHLVLIVDDADSIDLAEVGPSLENHELFTGRTNVHFVQVLDSGRIVQRTWERGAGETLACGTGACASTVAAFLNGLIGRVADVELPGGRLHVEYLESGHVFMTGPTATVYDGEWALDQPLAL